VGLLMEEEIPQALILLRSISRKSFCESYPSLSYNRLILSCLIRLLMGYLFLTNLFVTVVQADDVITIFFDILALEFVQHLDDVAFELCRKDILGGHLKVAAAIEYKVLTRAGLKQSLSYREDEENALIEKSNKQTENGEDNERDEEWRLYCLRRRKKKWNFRWILKAAYFVNFALLMMGTRLLGSRQQEFVYHCQSVTITFGDEVWENAYVTNHTNPSQDTKQRTLIYSYFNGVYKITDSDSRGRPIYTEMNKNVGDRYQETVGAQIVYCEDEEAWVFQHKYIAKEKIISDEGECPHWLLRSAKTRVYDLTEVPNEDWSVWTGVITPGNKVSIVCNTCNRNSDCNNHGGCGVDGACMCNDGFFGLHCEFEKACKELIDDEGQIYEMVDDSQDNTLYSYTRPIYVSKFRVDFVPILFDNILTNLSESVLLENETIIENEDAVDLSTLQKLVNTTNTCHPTVKKFKLESTSGEQISMFEFQAYSNGLNVAIHGTASQSSSFISSEVLDASKAIDGDFLSYSQTNDASATWEVDLDQSREIGSVMIVNKDCGNSTANDELDCACRMNSNLLLLDESEEVLTTLFFSDSCNQKTIFENFDKIYPCSNERSEISVAQPETSSVQPETSNPFDVSDNSTSVISNQIEDLGLGFELWGAIALIYSGSRWYGSFILSDDKENFDLAWKDFGDEYHAFWDELYESRTYYLSDPTKGATPVGVDVYEKAQNPKWDDYGPYGLLIPLYNISGKGYFHCFGTNLTTVKVNNTYW